MKSSRFFRELTPEALARRIPGLTVGRGLPTAAPAARAAEELRALGWSAATFPMPFVAPLRDAVEILHSAGLPLVALYAFDATWALGVAIAQAIGDALGAHYDLVSDFWAFRIQPGHDGWPPHRGASNLLDRERPELLNVWVALSDAAVNQACMHFVPLDEDGAYRRGDLADVAPPVSVASPVAAGTALFWNANVLHWGGACAMTASGPRVSATFTMERSDIVTGTPRFCPARLTPQQRIDAITDQVTVYAPLEEEAIHEWATVHRHMRDGLPGTRR